MNPAAFMRPVKGQFGNAPRTIDAARWPTFYLLDLSLQKKFKLGGEGKRYLEFRVDAINAFNHPLFQFGRDSDNGEVFTGAPSENTFSTTEYNNWATFNGQPLQSTPAGLALFTQINNMVRSYNINPAGQAQTMMLPNDFFTVPLPNGLWSLNANSFDIRTVNGWKMYRMRNVLATSRFGYLDVLRGAGALAAPYTPRFLQFALKLYF